MKDNKDSIMNNYETIIQDSMDKISLRVKKILISYVQNLYEIRLASAIAILGADSLEAKEALKETDKKSKESIIELAKEMTEKRHARIAQEVDSILSDYEMEFANEYKAIKKNLIFVGHDKATKLIEEFRNDLPILQYKLNDCIFNFDDLQYISDRNIQKLLNKVDQQQLAKALKGSSTEVQDKVFRNMSKTTSNMLKEDLQYMGPLSFEEVESAQNEMIRILFDLEKDGKLVINKLHPSELIK